MSNTARIVAAGLLILLGATVAQVFLGGQVSSTLGPLPRTIYMSPIMSGYWDVACSTTAPYGDPDGCSTPLASLDPAAVAAAVPLEVPSLDVPVTKAGPLEIYLGEAKLANGVLHGASFHLEGIEPGLQALPSGLDVADFIRLEVRSTDASRPALLNGYTHGWHPGVEVVKAYLVLDVTKFDAGTVLKIRDVLVR